MWEDKERRKEETQEALNNMPIALMKNFDGSKGMGSFNNGEYKIAKDGMKAEYIIIFNTIDELSDAGWTITT